MRLSPKKAGVAFTLVEMMISLAAATLILTAVIAAGVSLQKSFAAVAAYSTAESNQLRVLDYIAMDCRRAIAASATPAPHSGVTVSELSLTLPPYYSSADNTAAPATPSISGGTLSYGASNVTIKYYQNGGNFTREVITSTTDTTANIATNVAAFSVNTDLTKSVSCSIMFFPTFTHLTGTGTWWSGQNNPDVAPFITLGNEGDWYVINATAADPATVGSVYFKSGGTWSLIQNEKATAVFCNTFLRNGAARH
jgi:hypothetical protein